MGNLIVAIIALVLGSLAEAITWRVPRKISFINDRSKCPKCNHTIAWYDNIPLFSYLQLNGKCRNCHKKIPNRAPIIELSSLITFLTVYNLTPQITSSMPWLTNLNILALPVIFLITFTMLVVFIIDFEHLFIPDTASFGLFAIIIIAMLFSNTDIFPYLFAAFVVPSILFALNLLTKGKGMGLGDVKLALPIGLSLGPKLVIPWLMLSFVVGGVFGAFLLLSKNAKLKDKVAFGPFLIIGYLLILVTGEKILLLFNF